MSSSMTKRLVIIRGVRHFRGMERRKEGILIVSLISFESDRWWLREEVFYRVVVNRLKIWWDECFSWLLVLTLLGQKAKGQRKMVSLKERGRSCCADFWPFSADPTSSCNPVGWVVGEGQVSFLTAHRMQARMFLCLACLLNGCKLTLRAIIAISHWPSWLSSTNVIASGLQCMRFRQEEARKERHVFPSSLHTYLYIHLHYGSVQYVSTDTEYLICMVLRTYKLW